MIRCLDDPMRDPSGILAATGRGLLQCAQVCYKQLYAQMDERALEAPQEGRRRFYLYQRSNQGARALAAQIL